MQKIKINKQLEIWYLEDYNPVAKVLIHQLKIKKNPFPLDIYLKSYQKYLKKQFNRSILCILNANPLLNLLQVSFPNIPYFILFDKINYKYKQAYAKNKSLICKEIDIKHNILKRIKFNKYTTNRIIIFDDIWTSGNTIKTCYRLLLQNIEFKNYKIIIFVLFKTFYKEITNNLYLI
ncbi:hypothetical protein [Mycoplasma sp. SG1]|uniref:hypothetical protein n=1 Tax=Mycoplasma sp. SG1 TaxID=2810348 RepID=UPI00202418AF|nr:hypothetical protein [Mycoplasma sp. SG1]URM52977.1 hypothetical protein JRW51_01365 [Mycoplasma sp. SG1]